MFPGVDKKLERARYFLNNIKALAEAEGGIAHIPADKQQHFRANLDGFFFEIISAKDFFLQGINNEYQIDLPRDEATKINQLKRCLFCHKYEDALKVVTSIEKLLDTKDSWLWKLNNYRNSATHRELLHVSHVLESDIKTYLFKDPEDSSQKHADLELITYCEQSLERIKKFLEDLYSELPQPPP